MILLYWYSVSVFLIEEIRAYLSTAGFARPESPCYPQHSHLFVCLGHLSHRCPYATSEIQPSLSTVCSLHQLLTLPGPAVSLAMSRRSFCSHPVMIQLSAPYLNNDLDIPCLFQFFIPPQFNLMLNGRLRMLCSLQKRMIFFFPENSSMMEILPAPPKE